MPLSSRSARHFVWARVEGTKGLERLSVWCVLLGGIDHVQAKRSYAASQGVLIMTQSSPGPAGQTAVRPLRVAQMSQIALKPHENRGIGAGG